MVSVGMKFIKYILFVLNLIFTLCGIAIIAIGVLVLTGVISVQYISSFSRGTVIFFIVIGAIIFVVAFLGCCGAIRESFIKLILYAVALILIFIFEIVVVAIIASSGENVDGELNKQMRDSLANYQKNSTDKDAWDSIQAYFECCGVDGPADWAAKGIPLPDTCCQTEPQNKTALEHKPCMEYGEDLKYLRNEGCHDKVLAMLNRCCYMIYITAAAAGIFELLAIGVSIWLAVVIKQEDSY